MALRSVKVSQPQELQQSFLVLWTGRDDGLALTRVPNAPRTDKATTDGAIPLDISSVRQHDGTKMRCNGKTLSCTLV